MDSQARMVETSLISFHPPPLKINNAQIVFTAKKRKETVKWNQKSSIEVVTPPSSGFVILLTEEWSDKFITQLLKPNSLFLNKLSEQTIWFYHQLSIWTSLGDLPIIQDNNVVSVFDGWEPMCDGDDCSPLHQSF